MTAPPRPLRPLAAVLVLALVVRVGAALYLGLDGPPRGDERGYLLLAEGLAAGEGLRLPVPAGVLLAAGAPAETVLHAFRGPLVPLVGAPLVAAGGGLAALRLLAALLGACAAPLLLLAARPLLGARWAVTAAVAYALWPPHVYGSAAFLSEPLSTPLLVAGASLAARARTHASGRSGLAAGLVSGLAVLARPSALLPAAALALVAGDRRRGMLLALGLLAAVAPWVLRNQAVVGSPVLTTNSGVTLVGGNSEAAARAAVPGKWQPPEIVYAGAEHAPDLGMWGWSTLGESGSNARFTGDAFAWSRAHPGDLCRLVLRKLLRLVDPDPHSTKPDAALKARVGWATLAPVLLLAVLALLLARTAVLGAGWQPWWALLAGTVLTAAVFYGDTRMRAAADPTLLLLAAAGARAVARRVRPAS